MKTVEFQGWLTGLQRLSREQRTRVKQQLVGPAQQEEVIGLLERAAPTSCSHCSGSALYRWGVRSGLQRYRCRGCGHTFTALSGTELAHLRRKDVWLNYGEALSDGLTVRKAANHCGIDKNTAFRWRHRFLRQAAQTKAERLEGIVEADETFFPHSLKGQRALPRPARKRGSAIHQRGTGSAQVPVLILRDRHGATADFKLKKADLVSVEPILRQRLAPDAVLCSDGAAIYHQAARHIPLAHRQLNLSKGIRVLAKVYHIQNVNAYDSRLKTWMGRFHGVATKYLENYLGWRRWLERHARHPSPSMAIAVALGAEEHFQPLTQT
ncbi:MAG: IS1595 family transposase [Gammaproteobacteria bacterium]